MDRLQQPAAACLLRDCVRGRTAGADHGAGHVPGAVDSDQARQPGACRIQAARSLHFLVLVWFLFFIVMHVTLVFTTGLAANLNHIYAGRNDSSWIGFTLFAVSMAIMIFVWVAATPFTLRHPRAVQRIGFALVGPAAAAVRARRRHPGEYAEKDISPYFWHNGAFPTTEYYRELYDEGFAGWRLKVHGLVDNPVELSLDELRALPHHEQITQHFCIQGWSGIAKWGGVSMAHDHGPGQAHARGQLGRLLLSRRRARTEACTTTPTRSSR